MTKIQRHQHVGTVNGRVRDVTRILTPGTVVEDYLLDERSNNYLLALRNREFARAWTYLSPSLAGYPSTSERLTDDVMSRADRFGLGSGEPATLQVRPEISESGDSAVVNVDETRFVQNGLFDSGESTIPLTVQLRRDAGAWQIVDVDPERYWDDCWADPADPACSRKYQEGLPDPGVEP